MHSGRRERRQNRCGRTAFVRLVPTQELEEVAVVVVPDPRHTLDEGRHIRIVDAREEPRDRTTNLWDPCLRQGALLLVVGERQEPVFKVLLNVVQLEDVDGS